MLKFYKAFNFRAKEVNDHKIQTLLENSIFLRKREYFHNYKIDFFLINVNKFQYFKVNFENQNSFGIKIVLFTDNFTHLHYNTIQLGREAISGCLVIFARNFLAFAFSFIVTECKCKISL